jgi:hypothetical protein
MRTPIGIALALLFYLVLRGGLIVPSLPSATPTTDTTHLLNPYGIGAISEMAGMFSKQATDKLREIFDTLFRTQEPVTRADPLVRTKPVISRTEPTQLTVNGSPTVTVHGSGFQRNSTAVVNGASRNLRWVSDTQVVVTLLAIDLAAVGELQLVIRNVSPASELSEPFRILVT